MIDKDAREIITGLVDVTDRLVELVDKLERRVNTLGEQADRLFERDQECREWRVAHAVELAVERKVEKETR